ncbi:Cysteine--tRNA ligase [Candidatus Trichorickettsia mobilis]|uniref:Cysteine--tRNA ligase n=1 Tax=Candidatus Trichorickettsia mobilis TaxID=1346319 RepID=A0ABZ0UUJ8_9RICK|nr:cysteine--tRNA ligase [Candidatus Trichorickettsia mobilis]WPY01333.1 Cysteine--tRNA ligase [Candidatus Trichorickettsia mobilis]
MQLFLNNTKTRTKEAFIPINNNLVKMYVCGPTVYDHPHIGNGRSVIIYDILYRMLIHLFGKEQVVYVRNITDVDDKIIDRAMELQISIEALTKQTTKDFHEDMAYLQCLSPNIEPIATEHIDCMIEIIQKLIALEVAYITDDHVYFDITRSIDYTELSGRTIDEMIYNVRVAADESKKHPGDFVLWKPMAGTDISANFDSPWGRGRPGWHIECSAMSHKYLGENFDIHGGGADLIFPHHTNEIAQSKCAFPGSNFANYWVHNGFLTVNGEKMSKSLGNFITVRDLIIKGVDGDTIRLALLGAHYHKPLDFNDHTLANATKMLNYWYRAVEGVSCDSLSEVPLDFIASLLDDMNTPLAIKIINDYAKLTYLSTTDSEKKLNASSLLACARFIGLMKKSATTWFKHDINDEAIISLINQRTQAKKDKNWQLADQIRMQLLQQGVVLADKADGTTDWWYTR